PRDNGLYRGFARGGRRGSGSRPARRGAGRRRTHRPVLRQRTPRFHLPLNFLLLDTPWDAASLAAAIDRYLNSIPDGAWPVGIPGSHDKPRIASTIGPAQARIAAMLLLTLQGTPIFFAGDEIAMPSGDSARSRARSVRDPRARLWLEPRSTPDADALG